MKKIIVEEFIKATNSHNWKKVLSLTHSNFIRHSSSIPHEIHGNHSLVEFHKNELKTFPDLDEKIEFLIEENDLVAARIKFTGTQKGKLGKFPRQTKYYPLHSIVFSKSSTIRFQRPGLNMTILMD